MIDSNREPAALSTEENRRMWDRRAKQRERFTKPATDAMFKAPLANLDGCGWLGKSVAGKHVLCLAAGGGNIAPLFAAAGAYVTVVDISSAMLELDRQVAQQRGLKLYAVQSSMDDLSALRAEEFDIVSQPVSTCYVPDACAVYREVARVTAPGGLYISQHKQPASLQADVKPVARGYELIEPYYRTGPLPNVDGSLHRESGTKEFLHRWEDLIGGLCRAGFIIEDLMEPYHADARAAVGTFQHRSNFVAPYVRIKARRKGSAASSKLPGHLWTP